MKRKTSVYLDESELRRLSDIARLEGRSQAEIIRDAIATYRPKGSPDRNFELVGIAEGPGGSVADIPEEELLEGFGE